MGCGTVGANPNPSPIMQDWPYPSTDWVAVTRQAASEREAEDAARNALARTFNTNITSIIEINERFSEIVHDAAGKKSVTFGNSTNIFANTKIWTSVNALIGVVTETFHAADRTWYANARMNRHDCAVRYASMVRENEAVINGLLSRAAALQSGFDAYAALYYAASIAQATDNFQNILEVLDPSAVNRRPNYGSTAAIKTQMLVPFARRITIGLSVETEDQREADRIRGALGAFFTDRGFKVNQQGADDYTLKANVTFEKGDTTDLKTCRWDLNAPLEDRDGKALFWHKGRGSATAFQDKEARSEALCDVESSIKEGDFVKHFNQWLWLGSLLE
ncbi:hypothetical protein FACS1894200_03820 [Spirochaetia bacterium]|nr:hypothetical protein FACS1894200_03820 [Spirochaetia bacterium]